MKNIKFTEMRQEFNPGQVRKFAFDEFPDAQMGDLNDLGISIAQDADVDSVLSQTGFTPLQYLQYNVGQAIEALTTPTKIDDICGRSIVANWETEEIIQPLVEGAGVPQLYGDDNDAPYASFEFDFEKRTVQRFELAIRVGKLEDARLSAMTGVGMKSPWALKRAANAKAFSLLLDEIGHRGFYNGAGVTCGLFSDPNELPVTAVQTGKWNTRTYQQITSDIRFFFETLASQTDTHFSGLNGDKCTLYLAPSAFNALATENEHGKSVRQYIEDNYKGCRTVVGPRLKGAAANGADYAFLIADELNGSPVVKQFIPQLMRLNGIEKRLKHTAEDYTCATAGVMVCQPLGLLKISGI